MTSARILLVDDNAANLKLASKTLQFAGHEVTTAANGQTALSLLETRGFDLILMDIGLPDIDGLTLTRQLKQDDRTRHIPVIILTAFAMREDKQRAFEAGCADFITKPINTRTFSKQIEQYLTGKDHQG